MLEARVGVAVGDVRWFRLWLCARPKDFPPCQHDELIALVERLQEQVAGLKAANEELQRQLAESPAWRKAAGGSVLEGQAKQQGQASRPQAWYGVVQLPPAALSR